MTAKMLYEDMKTLEKFFDVVRLVDASRTKVLSVSENGVFAEDAYCCFSIWNKDHRCDNCISEKVLSTKGQLTKFEFHENQVYFVIANHVIVDDVPYVLEMGKLTNDQTLFGAYDKNDFIEKISAYNTKIYTDALTGCYNRRYFDEQFSNLESITAAAMLDIDDFKAINDTYGHEVGDAALRTFASVLQGSVRAKDRVIRIGGDEFIIIFQELPKELLEGRLNALLEKLKAAVIPGYPDIRFTTSIGGCYCQKDAEDIFRRIDALMYEAKKSKNAVVVRSDDN